MIMISFQGVQVAFYPNKTVLYAVLGIVAALALAMVGVATVFMAMVNFVLTAPTDSLVRLSACVLAILLSVLVMRFGTPAFFRRQRATGMVV